MDDLIDKLDVAIVAAMKRTGITKSDLARQLGISRQAVDGFFEAGDVKLSTVEKYCQKLGIRVRFEGK